ncbi:MAG: hypothetical protein WC375_02260 [Methanomassiliicoccales archaeon]
MSANRRIIIADVAARPIYDGDILKPISIEIYALGVINSGFDVYLTPGREGRLIDEHQNVIIPAR